MEPLPTELLLNEHKTGQKTTQVQEFHMPMQEVTGTCNAIQNTRLQLQREQVTEMLNLQVEKATDPVIQAEEIHRALVSRRRALVLAGLQVHPL